MCNTHMTNQWKKPSEKVVWVSKQYDENIEHDLYQFDDLIHLIENFLRSFRFLKNL